MKTGGFDEKRRSKRLDLSLPITVKRASGKEKAELHSAVTINVSYNGAYVVDIGLKNIKPEDHLNVSISVPREEARDFPFSRLTGKAKVVRVEKQGVALEFGEEMSRLFVAN